MADDQQIAKYLGGVVGYCEANSFESLCLWREYTEELGKPWVQTGFGHGITIGHLADMPVHISLLTTTVDGHKVLFWEATSQVVDHRLIESWLEQNLAHAVDEFGRPNRADAMNFHNIMHTAGRLALRQENSK